MYPRWHVLFGFIFSYVLVYFFDFSLFSGMIIFLSSIFIDLDHVLLYYLETKNLNPKKFFSWSEKKNNLWKNLEQEEKNQFKSPQFVLHGIEFMLLLIILSKIHVFFWWVFLGISLHLVLDLIDIINRRKHYHISAKISQVWSWYRNKGKRYFKHDSA